MTIRLRDAALGAGLIVLTSGLITHKISTNGAEDGRVFLLSEGMENVSGGQFSFFNGCAKGTVGREYQATLPNGERKDVTVCLGGMFGPGYPLLGKPY